MTTSMTRSARSIDRAVWLMAHFTLAVLISLLTFATARAQQPPTVEIGIFHVAPGKHVEFLRWQAAREAVAAEAGLPAAQWYAHMDGDSWDYISIAPVTTDEQDAKADAIAARKGLTTEFKAAIEFRTMIQSHTDTRAGGPTTAAALLQAATK